MKHSLTGMSRLYHQGDRIMIVVCWIMVALAFVLASWYQTWQEALWIGLPAGAVPTALMFLLPAGRLTRSAMGAAFMILSALHIHQAHGMLEMHFGIFVLLAFLLFYRDWLPIIVAAGVIAVHHLAFNFLQESGYPVFVFANRTGISIVLIHAAFVVFESVILVYMSVLFRKEAVQAIELREIGRHLAVVDGKIDLKYRQANAQSIFAKDFNHFIDEIDQTMKKVQQAASHLNSATEEMMGISAQSDQSMQRQHTEVDQVATAINQMTATVQEVARNATAAATAAGAADVQANEGRKVVTQTIDAIETLASRVEQAAEVINRVHSHTEEIGMVLEVIKDIAEQTNLLALNAAIEAARAGEQGRGFAVVADEVRTLASRTRKSTEEIHSMIEQLQSGAKEAVSVMEEGREHAKYGVEQTSHTGEALDEITAAVSTINDMNTQIASAAEQQSMVAEEINKNIVNISQVAAQTAEGVRQGATASQGLESLATEMRLLVDKFQV